MIYHGTITMESGARLPLGLYPGDAPHTVKNFVKLVKGGYYDGKAFHRIIKNFISQGGCPHGTGTGNLGYTIPCGMANNPHKHGNGSLSIAHRGKDTGCCQLSICHYPQPHLDGIHAVFGKVADNLGAARNMRSDDVMKKVVTKEI